MSVLISYRVTKDELVKMTAKDSIGKAAESEMHRSSYPGLRAVRCDYRKGVLTLRGRVGSFYLKQLAQECVRKISEVEIVDNRLEVAAFTISTCVEE